MKKRMNAQSAACLRSVLPISVSIRMNSAASFLYALRFYFFVFFAFFFARAHPREMLMKQ